MHRTLRWAAATAATGVVLVVAAHSAGAAAGTPSPEPSCELVRQQARAAAEAHEAASASYLRHAQLAVTAGNSAADERARLRALSTASAQRMLQLNAITLGSPRCFAPEDVEMARRSVQQLAPELAGV